MTETSAVAAAGGGEGGGAVVVVVVVVALALTRAVVGGSDRGSRRRSSGGGAGSLSQDHSDAHADMTCEHLNRRSGAQQSPTLGSAHEPYLPDLQS